MDRRANSCFGYSQLLSSLVPLRVGTGPIHCISFLRTDDSKPELKHDTLVPEPGGKRLWHHHQPVHIGVRMKQSMQHNDNDNNNNYDHYEDDKGGDNDSLPLGVNTTLL
jgi:hypothetical protein